MWLANVAKSRRNWFARMVAVRSANRLPLRGSPFRPVLTVQLALAGGSPARQPGSPRARSTVSRRGPAPPPACNPGKSRRSGRREDPAAPPPAASGSTTFGSGNGSRRTAPRRSRRSGGATCAIACARSGGRCGTTGRRLRCLRTTSRRGPPSPRTTVSGQRLRSRARRRVDVRRPQPRTQGRPCRAEGSSKSSRDVPPGCRAPGRRWSRCPERSRGDGQASRDRSTLRSSPAATFLYRRVSASPGTPGPVHGARSAECRGRGPAPPRSGRPTASASALSPRSWSLTSS